MPEAKFQNRQSDFGWFNGSDPRVRVSVPDEANKTACDPFTVLWLRAQERKYEALAVGADVIPATLLTDCAG